MADPAPGTPTAEDPPTEASTAWLGLVGAVAAAVGLGASELVAGIFEAVPSLVVGVGQWIIDGAPLGMVRFGISVFGTDDKPALVVGIVLACMLVGALVSSRSRPVGGLLVPGTFIAFGVVGALATISSMESAVFATLANGAIAATAGILAWRWGSAPGATSQRDLRPERESDQVRRQLLVRAGAGAALALVTAGLGRRLADRLSVESARADTRLPSIPGDTAPASAGELEVPGLSSHVTSNSRFYRIDTAIVLPQVDPDGWALRVNGMVDRELEIGFDELVDMAMTEEEVTLTCVSNEVGGDLVSNAVWQGVPLTELLERAGVQPGAEQVVGRAVDGWSAGFPIEAARDGRPALVAVGMNGEPLPIRHGFPARLVVSGLYGYVSATKWLEQIELTTWDGHDGYWIPRGWAKEAPVKTQSRIDVPRSGARLAPGQQPIAGVAWAQNRGIERVEVRIDGGRWAQCRLAGAGDVDTWKQWLYEWDAGPGDHRIEVRATDSTGVPQTAETTGPVPDGATGHHTVSVRVEA